MECAGLEDSYKHIGRMTATIPAPSASIHFEDEVDTCQPQSHNWFLDEQQNMRANAKSNAEFVFKKYR